MNTICGRVMIGFLCGLVFYIFIKITLFFQLFVWVGILYVHYDNAVRTVICVGWDFICSLK